VDDAAYIAILVLVCNAAHTNIFIMSLCPAFVRSHYTYLHDKWSEFFPEPIVVCARQLASNAVCVYMDVPRATPCFPAPRSQPLRRTA
jgi:hypothetical protein